MVENGKYRFLIANGIEGKHVVLGQEQDVVRIV
jgi:hypothetical protein